MAWTLFLLVAAGVIAFFVWDYRRKTARREAASKERFEQIFKAKAVAAPASESVSTTSPLVTGSSASKTPAAAAATPARKRFIGQPETLIYYLLKVGIPDHEVFANVTLASVVGVPDAGSEREQQLRRLSQYLLDFVICDKSMRIVAVVDVEAQGGAEEAAKLRVKSDCLSEAGVRFVRINPNSLPSRDAIRGLIRGGPDAAGK